MGTLYYDGSRLELTDRVLAHVQLVISMKLRRHEGFFLSWTIPKSEGNGRNCLWIDNGVPLRIQYAGSRPPLIDRQWAETLAEAANTTNGLVLTDDPVRSDGG